MSFLFPKFLFGLLAVAVPIIIHLFNFQRPKTIRFTNVKFLRNVKEITTSRLKLKHLLVLLCRILFITFAVLTFAQPFLPGKEAKTSTSKQNVIAYFDNSFSMQSGNQGENLLDLALRNFRALTDKLSLHTQFQIFTNDFESKDQFVISKDKLNEQLSGIQFSYTSRDLSSVVKRINSSTANDAGAHQIFLFSDFQKSTLGDLKNLPLDSNYQYFFVPMQASQKDNIYIDSLWLSNPIVRLNESNQIQAYLNNTSTESEKKVLVKLYIDNIQVNATEVIIPPQGQEKLSLNFTCNSIGQKKCKLIFEDYPVVYDNIYHFVLQVSPQVKIFNISDSKDSFVSKVFSNQQLFDVKTVSSSDIDYALVESYKMLILENIDLISEPLLVSVSNFLKKGGSLVVFPSENPNAESYKKLFNQLALPSYIAIKTDTLGIPFQNFRLSVPNFQQPFFKQIFEKEDKKMDMPFAFPSISLQRRGEKMLETNNGEFFLSRFNFLNGKIYLFSTPLILSKTNFPKHALFVPVMYKMAFESLQQTSRIAYSIDESSIEHTLEEKIEDTKQMFSLNKEDYNIIPLQQLRGNNLLFSVPNISFSPGVYNLILDKKSVAWFAFNQDKNESENTVYSLSELQEIVKKYKNVKVYEGNVDDTFIKSFNADFIGTALWKYCLIAAIFFILAEILLIRLYK